MYKCERWFCINHYNLLGVQQLPRNFNDGDITMAWVEFLAMGVLKMVTLTMATLV
jgi:hypothetical protein